MYHIAISKEIITIMMRGIKYWKMAYVYDYSCVFQTIPRLQLKQLFELINMFVISFYIILNVLKQNIKSRNIIKTMSHITLILKLITVKYSEMVVMTSCDNRKILNYANLFTGNSCLKLKIVYNFSLFLSDNINKIELVVIF